VIIEFWERSSDNSPVERFLRKLDDDVMGKVVDLISIYDKPQWTYLVMVNAGDLKSLGSGLYELKIKACGTFFRFPAAVKGETLVLLDGFKKQKNKLENKDIKRARKLYDEFLMG
jgi:putative component of toxin-antitoxin plasmid stabilization module